MIIVRPSWHTLDLDCTEKSISTILKHYIYKLLKNLFLKFLEKYLIIGYNLILGGR